MVVCVRASAMLLATAVELWLLREMNFVCFQEFTHGAKECEGQWRMCNRRSNQHLTCHMKICIRSWMGARQMGHDVTVIEHS